MKEIIDIYLLATTVLGMVAIFGGFSYVVFVVYYRLIQKLIGWNEYRDVIFLIWRNAYTVKNMTKEQAKEVEDFIRTYK